MPKRRKLNRAERYAAVILMLKRGDGRPIVTLDEARQLSTAEIIAAFEQRVEWDHAFPHALGGSTHPTNMQPLVKEEHAAKTKKDRKAISKSKRIERRRQETLIPVDVRGARDDEHAPRKRQWPKRPFPGSKADKRRRAEWGKNDRFDVDCGQLDLSRPSRGIYQSFGASNPRCPACSAD